VSPPADGPRGPGRPRSPQAEAAIVDATLDLIADEGFGTLSVERIAARAGVGKATIYRRWAGRDELVVDALSRLPEQSEPVRGDDVREDLVRILEALRRRHAGSRAGRILPRLVAEAVDHPELMRLYRERVMLPRRARMAAVLRRGVDAGELPAGLDVEYAVDLLVGPLFYRLLMRPTDGPVPADLPARLVDDVLAGLRA
jgi:AcrR family transcriptional regulator